MVSDLWFIEEVVECLVKIYVLDTRDEWTSFGISVGQTLKRFDVKKAAFVKFKIMQLLLEHEE